MQRRDAVGLAESRVGKAMLKYKRTVESTTNMWGREPARPDGVVM